MIALDTNILVRYFMHDDLKQLARVRAVMSSLSSTEPAWVGLACIQELVWVSTSFYRASRAEVIRMLDHLVSLDEVEIEQPDALRHALSLYKNTKVSFSDCLISSSAKAVGCSHVLTFDEQAAKTAGMTLVP
jgi:predicted nucleic-acid-binding protein